MSATLQLRRTQCCPSPEHESVDCLAKYNYIQGGLCPLRICSSCSPGIEATDIVTLRVAAICNLIVRPIP
jgi:hypothetical protein